MTEIAVESIEDLTQTTSPKEAKTGSLEGHIVEPLDSEGVTEEAYQFLTAANEQESAKEFEAVDLARAFQETEAEMAALKQALAKPEQNDKPTLVKESPKAPEKRELHPETQKTTKCTPQEQLAHSRSDIFGQRDALAKMLRAHQTEKAPFFATTPRKENREKAEERLQVETTKAAENNALTKSKESEKEREGQGEHQQQDEEQKKKRQRFLKKRVASVDGSERKGASAPSEELQGDIFTRFMALMARILGQAQADAHALYRRIKERTDNIDILTGLIGKINNTEGKVDWSEDPQMRALIDKARALGVEIPEGKYSWTEEEKRYLKENIQMRKDSLEKVTQLERTDMQRYMQEASQCHQARSNVLKLIKEVMDTINHNLRG